MQFGCAGRVLGASGSATGALQYLRANGGVWGMGGGAAMHTTHSVRLIRPLRGGKGTCTREHVRTIPSALKLLLVLLDIVDAAIVVVRLD